jgi:hypothetical protein
MENDYPFAWFDELIEIKCNLNPMNITTTRQAELTAAIPQLSDQADQVLRNLKHKIFSAFEADQKKAVITAYLDNISFLREQLLQNLDQSHHPAALTEASEQILAALNYLQETIRSRYTLYLREQQATHPLRGDGLYKVLVRLSVDQIAIILKAADDVKILTSRSLSLIYRRIMPFVSTERCKDVSWKSARSSTYKMEDTDKTTAIAVLQQLIRQIESY